jgi:ABC-type sugar transport system permease subunit
MATDIARVSSGHKPRALSRRKIRDYLTAYLFLAPYLLVYLVFLLIPVFWSMWLALRQGGLLSGTKFVGLQNFSTIWGDALFRQSVRNTIYYTLLVVPIAMTLSLLLALLIHNMRRVWQNIVKVALFLPLVSSVVALSIIWKAIFSPTREAPLNLLVGLFGVPPQNWLGNPSLVIPSIVGFEIWRGYGFWVILFLAGLDAIPAEIHDAASVDGANAWQKFWSITLPLLRPTVLFLSVMGLIWNFQLFDAVYMLTGGGPANSSATVVWYVYRSAFHFEKLGYGATMGIFLLIVILALTLIQFRLGRSEIEY